MNFRKCFLIMVIGVVVLFSGCVKENNQSRPLDVSERVVGTEEIGGKYNTTVVDVVVSANGTDYNMKKIRYVKDGKVVEPDAILSPEMIGGLEWMKENTPPDAVVLAWWDHGHMIRGYAEREVVLDAPSREILASTVSKYIGKAKDEIECDDCAAHGIIMDAARAFTEDDAGLLKRVMDKYGATILYVQTADRFKSYAFYVSYGADPVDYRSDVFMRTNVGRAIDGGEIEGFDHLYSDGLARIYMMKQ